MRLTTLNGEIWPGATRSLLFGVYVLKIEFRSALPPAPFKATPSNIPHLQYFTQLLIVVLCVSLVVTVLLLFVCFCFELLLVVIIAKFFNFSIAMCAFFKIQNYCLKNLFGFPEISDLWVWI